MDSYAKVIEICETHPKTKVIALTTVFYESMTLYLLSKGCNAFMNKPLKP
jgi:hypothetical protein